MPCVTKAERNWRALWVAAIVLPIVAVFLLPPHYSFYMFHPATPGSPFEHVRLWVANGVLVVAAAAGICSAIAWTVLAFRRRKWLYLLAPALIVLHPILQAVYFEDLDTYLNYRWYGRAMALRIMGKAPSEVVALLGEPSSVYREPTHTMWRYKPLPFYWIGSTGEVVFENDRVQYIEANDD